MKIAAERVVATPNCSPLPFRESAARMTAPIELRDPLQARDWLWQGLCLAAIQPLTGAEVSRALAWCIELASEQQPLPPLGIVADVGRLLDRDGYDRLSHGAASGDRAKHSALLNRAGRRWPWHVRYEDYVLGKVLADTSFERGATALARYRGRGRNPDRDSDRATAFVIEQIRRRAGASAAILSVAVLRELVKVSPETLLARGYESLLAGPRPDLVAMIEQWSTAARQLGECLGGEDLYELEQGTVLLAYSRRLALRQTLALVDRWLKLSPPKPSIKPSRRRDVATRLLDEDQYPVGGFTSISNRGSIESLLHSQLAYMEPDDASTESSNTAQSEKVRPDLFDIKFLRDELLYYSRDENQFLRRRRTIVFALPADWSTLRAKAAGASHQTSILLAAFVVTTIRLLIEWLGDEALRFHLVFHPSGHSNCDAEIELLQMALKDQAEHGSLTIDRLHTHELADRCQHLGQRSLCQVVVVGNDYPTPAAHEEEWLDVQIGKSPVIAKVDEEVMTVVDATFSSDPWNVTAVQLAAMLVGRG